MSNDEVLLIVSHPSQAGGYSYALKSTHVKVGAESTGVAPTRVTYRLDVKLRNSIMD